MGGKAGRKGVITKCDFFSQQSACSCILHWFVAMVERLRKAQTHFPFLIQDSQFATFIFQNCESEGTVFVPFIIHEDGM